MYRESVKTVISSIWPSLLILITILFTIRAFSFASSKDKVVFYKEALNLLFIVYLMCFFYILTFEDVDWSTANIIPFKEMFRFSLGSKMFFKNVFGNIILFLPYGFFLSYFVKLKKVKIIFALSLFVSFIVEIIQYRIGRVFDVDDILLNILGAIIGYYIYRLVAYLLNETRLNRKKEFICNLVTLILAVAAVLYLGV